MRLLCVIIAFCIFNTACGQIHNPSFELSNDTVSSMPQSWKIRKVTGYSMNLDTQQKQSGNKSFRIQGVGSLTSLDFTSFTQDVDIDATHLKQVAITCYVKTEGINGYAEVWCQSWNRKNKLINIQLSLAPSSYLTGTHNWTKLTLKLLVDTNTKRLRLGGLLTGGGTAWFDNFALEDVAVSAKGPSKQVVRFGNEIINIVRKNAIYADSLNWENVNSSITELSKGLTSADSAQILVDYLISKLRQAGDNHSFYQNKTRVQDYSSHNTVVEQPSGKLLEGNIGYISVPAFGSTNDTACIHFAEHLQNIIASLDTKQNIKGWVVDLRKNGGGNMYPMIAGLGPLIGEGTLGYFVNPKIRSQAGVPWFYNNGSSGASASKSVTVKQPYSVKDNKAKIAVLVGPGTASSGEMTTICFIGKLNSKLFGQPTAGYITSNDEFRLSTGASLYVAANYVADRNKKTYLTNIKPDVIVQDSNDKSTDAALNAATAWLKTN